MHGSAGLHNVAWRSCKIKIMLLRQSILLLSLLHYYWLCSCDGSRESHESSFGSSQRKNRLWKTLKEEERWEVGVWFWLLTSKEEHALYFSNSSSLISPLRRPGNSWSPFFRTLAVPALFIDYLVQLPQQRPPCVPTVAGTQPEEARRSSLFSQSRSLFRAGQFTGRCEMLGACQSDGYLMCAGLAGAAATLGRACCRPGAGWW